MIDLDPKDISFHVASGGVFSDTTVTALHKPTGLSAQATAYSTYNARMWALEDLKKRVNTEWERVAGNLHGHTVQSYATGSDEREVVHVPPGWEVVRDLTVSIGEGLGQYQWPFILIRPKDAPLFAKGTGTPDERYR